MHHTNSLVEKCVKVLGTWPLKVFIEIYKTIETKIRYILNSTLNVQKQILNNHLVSGSSFLVYKKGLNFAIIIFLLKLHASFPHSFWCACSDPKPNVNVFCHSSSINRRTNFTTVIVSSTFRTIARTTLKHS